MDQREVIRSFYAIQLPRDEEESCNSLEGCDLDSGESLFSKGYAPLIDGFHPPDQTVNGKPVVQFMFQSYSYCVERSVYERSTEEIKNPLNEKSA